MKTGDAVKRNDAPAGPGQTRYEGGVGGRAAIELSLACLPHA